MVENGDSKEDKFDFSSEGEALAYISLEQARLLAMQTAREAPGDYGRRFRGIRMVFQPVQEEEGEDYYVVTLSFRPEGDFAGNPGEEQFFIEKEGCVAHRQVLSHPRAEGGRHLPIIPIGIGLVIVAVVAIVAVLVVGRGGSDDGGTAAAEVIPTATDVPASPGASQSEPEATATPIMPSPGPTESTFPSPTPAIDSSETSRTDAPTPAVVPTSTPTPTPRPSATPLGLADQPEPTPSASASATPDSAPLRILLLRSVGNPRQLALVSRARTETRVEVPVVFGLPDADYSQLGSRLWTPSSLIFTGDGFSGSWNGQPRSELVLQLEGLEDANYSYCIAIRQNRNQFAQSCGSRLSNFEFNDAGLTTTTRHSAPTQIAAEDVFEIAIVLGNSSRSGSKPVPSLVYGGRTALTTSYLEITADPTIAGKGTCSSTTAASLADSGALRSGGAFRLYMVSTSGNPQALAPINSGTGEGFALEFPVASTRGPGAVLGELRAKLWTPSSLIFCGSGFSDTLPGPSQVQLQLQLGRIESSRIPYCVELRRNGAMLANSCSTGISGLTGDGRVRTGTINLEGPSSSIQITPDDVFEVSIDFSTGTNSQTPILHYGVAVGRTTSLIEITSGDS